MSKIRTTGKYFLSHKGREQFHVFVPDPLPPEPPIIFDIELQVLMDKANRALGRLDGVTSLLPNTALFTSFYLIKESLLSSQIEGTQSTLSEILSAKPQDGGGKIPKDTQEVLNYMAAFRFGFDTLREMAKPKITLELITEMHKILLSETKDDDGMLGQFRTRQNWIGGNKPSEAKFVPPPIDELEKCLNDFIDFLDNNPTPTPVIMKVALTHVQFETIHPFINGNGRLGRLLIVLLLCMEKALREPMLYLSLYFKLHCNEYYERLQQVRETGDWEGWLKFFFSGVIKVSEQAIDTATAILNLFEKDRERIATVPQSNTAHQIQSYLQKRPIVPIKELAKTLDLSIPSITSGLQRLEKIGMVEEMTGQSRNRQYGYKEYLRLLSSDTPFAEEIG